MTAPERLIIEGCKHGVRSAQKALYCHFKPMVFAVCLRYIRDSDESKDVLQDIFLRAFSKIHQYKGQGSFEGWLKRLTVNYCLNVLKKKKQFVTTPINDEDFVDDSEVEELAFSKDVLFEALEAIPIVFSAVFSMYVLDGFTHEEIAEELKIKEQTSRTRLHKAKMLLRQELKKSYEY